MRRWLLRIGGVALVVWVLLAAFWLVRVASDLKSGRAASSRARHELGAEQVAKQKPLPDLRVAAKRFGSAHDRADGLVLAPLRVLPVIGRQLRSITSLSGAAEGVALAGADAVERAGELFDHPAGSGQARVAQVRALSNIVEDVARRLATIDDLGPVHGLLAPLATARNQLASDLNAARQTVTDARRGARAALSLVTGPRRYLVVAANNAEARAGSGMWLQGGILETKDGALHLEQMAPLDLDAPLPAGGVIPSGDLAARWGFLKPGEEWRNLMASPRFPASAELAAQMWKAAGKGDIDGVFEVDAIGLRAIVEATGPIVVGERTIAADQVAREVLHDQYLAYGDANGELGQDNAARREALATMAKSAVHAIDGGGYRPSTLLRTLGEAVSGRHLLAWSTDAVEQQGWLAAGMDGELMSDSLLVSVLSRGANKLDWFLHLGATLAVKQARDGWDVAVTIHLKNTTPDGEPPYVAGPQPGLTLEPGEYRGILAVNVPGLARRSRFDGVDHLAVAGADGPTRVVGFQLDLKREKVRTVVLRFTLPIGVRHLVVEPSARVPELSWHYGSSTWQDSKSRTANW